MLLQNESRASHAPLVLVTRNDPKPGHRRKAHEESVPVFVHPWLRPPLCYNSSITLPPLHMDLTMDANIAVLGKESVGKSGKDSGSCIFFVRAYFRASVARGDVAFLVQL